MNFSDIYHQKMQEHREFVKDMPIMNKTYYASLLSQTYRFVSHTTRLLPLAAAHTPLENIKLRHDFLEHAHLEKGHSALLIRDLSTLGHKPEDFEELAPTSALYQSQYYWIQFVSSESFMGYALALEGMAVNGGETVVEMVEKYHSPKSATFFRVHHTEDPEHTEHGLELVKGMSAEIQKQVTKNFLQTYNLHIQMRLELAKALQSNHQLKASA